MLKMIRVAAVAAFLALPFAVRAEQPAAAPAEAAMPCPHAGMEGGCCGGACAAMQAKGAAGVTDQGGKAEAGGCPCQRAKAAKAAAEAEAAKQAKP